MAPRRRRGPGRPTPEPLALAGVLLAAGRRAGYTFEDAWTLMTDIVLNYMSDRRADEWTDVLMSTRDAWRDAYNGERSPLALLPREIPAALGFPIAAPAHLVAGDL